MKLATVLVAGLVMAGCSSQNPVQPESATAAASPSTLGQSSDVTAAAKPTPGVNGGVIVSDQNDCAIGPTNVNQLQPGQKAYVWLVFNSPTSVQGFTYQITGTNNDFDSGILRLRFSQCRKINIDDLWADFTTPTLPGEYNLTVFDESGHKVSSDNFSIS